MDRLFVFFAVLCLALSAHAADEPVKPPSMDVSGSRSSKAWVTLPSGSRVAVGEGVTWQGVRVHLALTWHLVAVDAATNKVLWDHNISAFWNRVSFEAVPAQGTGNWAVVLSPGRRRGETDHRKRFDLRSGTELVTPPPVPEGTPVKARLALRGPDAALRSPAHLLVGDASTWKRVRAEALPRVSDARLDAIDFSTSCVLLLASGDSVNCSGLTFEGAWQSDRRLLVRTDRASYQSSGGQDDTRPWGLVVLPRPRGALEIERDTQGLIGGPPLWKPSARFDRIPTAQETLRALALAKQPRPRRPRPPPPIRPR